MAEHARRYVGLAQDLARAGYATAALDHAGHGETCPAPQKRGVFDPANGATQLLQDFHTLREVVAARVGALPPFVLGHSMGSFLVRAYLPLHAQGLAGAIIMSTGSQAAASLAGGRAVVRLLAAMKGWDYRSKFVDGLGVGSYNRAFEKTVEAPTGVEWLSRDASQVAAYNSDPACGFMFSLSGYAMLFDLISRAQAPSAVELPHELPLLLLAGEQDPVGSFGRAPRELAATYTAAGVEDVDLIMYPGARHELLHELNASEVTADLVAWLEAHTPAPAPATPKVARRRERPYEL
jgi:alpha-beta hydrolase superfamily lysophospholipase